MKWRLEGIAQSVVMEFLVAGQPVIPDADSIRLTAWNRLGVKIMEEAYTPIANETPTEMQFTLAAGLNEIDPLSSFETRFLRVDFTHNSRPYFVQDTYRLHRMIPMTATPDDVRSLVAAEFDEMNDDEADVVSAYMALSAQYGPLFKSALFDTDYVSIAANKAIALQAAIDLLPSMQSRLLKSEKMDNSAYQRADIDFEKLEADLRAQLFDALAIVAVAVGIVIDQPVAPTIFVVVTQTDPITNT